MNKRKNIRKWIILNLLIISLGSLAILNFIYIPKFLTLISENQQLQTITITTYQNEKKLFTTKYQTKAKSLGDLMAGNHQIYQLEKFSGLGRYLRAVNYYDESGIKHTIEQKNPYYWVIYYQNKPALVGIDSFWLKTNDHIELHYLSYSF